MAGMTTVLTEFSDNGNSRQYTLPAHTVQKPSMVIQRRKVPTGNQSVAEDSIFILNGTVDAGGLPLSQRSSVEIVVRRPISGDPDDIAASLATARDILSSDEMTNTVSTQEWLE